MADWFKFYENDLDETRLQYAISQLPEVIPVWVGILSEACRHKVGTVSWGSDEIELFGFSKRLGLSIPKVNEAIILLEKIRYISRQPDSVTVIKWGEKQSEYCQKLTKKQNQAGDKNPNNGKSVGTLSGHCRDTVGQEERRGEEIREKKEREFPETPPMSRKDFDSLAEMRGVPKDCAEWFWNTHDASNWLDGRGNPIRKVEPLLLNALKVWRSNGAKKTNGQFPSSKKPTATIRDMVPTAEQLREMGIEE